MSHTDPDYELLYCYVHGTMTNHLNGICQKCESEDL